MISRTILVNYLDSYLKIHDIEDNHWNGLQIEGKETIKKIAYAVDAGISTFQKSIACNADMILVHHGHYFKATSPLLVGWRKERVQMLLEKDISLYAVHLPLDCHPEVGNNAQLFELLGARPEQPFDFVKSKNISWIGSFEQPKTIQEIETLLNTSLPTTCKTLPFGPKHIKTVAISSGGAGYRGFSQALDARVDLYISGDAVEIYQTAKDAKMNIIFAGHYATETLGIKALADHVKQKFNNFTCLILGSALFRY